MCKNRHTLRQIFMTLPFFCLLILFVLTGCSSGPSVTLPQLVVIDCSSGVIYSNGTGFNTANGPQFQLQELKHQITPEEQ